MAITDIVLGIHSNFSLFYDVDAKTRKRLRDKIVIC